MIVPAEECAVLEDVVEVVHVSRHIVGLAADDLDPLQAFLGELLAVLAVDLEPEKLHYKRIHKEIHLFP